MSVSEVQMAGVQHSPRVITQMEATDAYVILDTHFKDQNVSVSSSFSISRPIIYSSSFTTRQQ